MHPFEAIVGHEQAKRMLAFAIAHPRNGYLFSGPDGVGCHALAEAFVRACADHPLPHPLSSHPDIAVLERELMESGAALRKEIAVKAVRELRMRMSERPVKASRCIAYIPDADSLNEEGANALLKSVEEPSAEAIFVFVAHNPSNMPATLRSRLVTIELGHVPAPLISIWLTEQGVSPFLAEQASMLSFGRPGYAWRYVHDERFREDVAAAERTIANLLVAMNAGDAFAAIAETAERCDKAEDIVGEWRSALQLWQAALRPRFHGHEERCYDLGRIFLIAERRLGGPVSPRLWLELGFAHICDGKPLPNPAFVTTRFPYELEVRS
jgi:DNA polymerase III delta prime subunit